MAKYIKATDCADVISEKLSIPLGDLVDVFAEIPAADVVPKSEVEKLTVELEAMRGAANSYKMHYENAKSEVAREIFEEIETSLCYKFINRELHLVIRESDYREYKNKYCIESEVTK